MLKRSESLRKLKLVDLLQKKPLVLLPNRLKRWQLGLLQNKTESQIYRRPPALLRRLQELLLKMPELPKRSKMLKFWLRNRLD